MLVFYIIGMGFLCANGQELKQMAKVERYYLVKPENPSLGPVIIVNQNSEADDKDQDQGAIVFRDPSVSSSLIEASDSLTGDLGNRGKNGNLSSKDSSINLKPLTVEGKVRSPAVRFKQKTLPLGRSFEPQKVPISENTYEGIE